MTPEDILVECAALLTAFARRTGALRPVSAEEAPEAIRQLIKLSDDLLTKAKQQREAFLAAIQHLG